MDDYINAIIRVKVPKWQIGEEVSVYFPDTMKTRGRCEMMPPQGEWFFSKEHQAWTCTHCGGYFGEIDNKNIFLFCPNCGAKMKGGAE